MMLSRDNILKAKSAYKYVDVPFNADGVIRIRVMSAAQREQYESQMLQAKEKGVNVANFRAVMIAMTACDEKGEPIFTLEDVEDISKLDWSLLDAAYIEALKLNGMFKTSVDDAKKN